MRRVTTVAGCAILLAAFLVGTGRSGEKGGTPTKKVGLPKYWSKLKLTAEQRDKISKVRTDYARKITALKSELKKLEREDKAASYALLTEEQKAQLRVILGVGAEKASDKKSSADKKTSKEK